jgi:hypothetical protein
MYCIEMYNHLRRPPLYRLNLDGTHYAYEQYERNSVHFSWFLQNGNKALKYVRVLRNSMIMCLQIWLF